MHTLAYNSETYNLELSYIVTARVIFDISDAENSARFSN